MFLKIFLIVLCVFEVLVWFGMFKVVVDELFVMLVVVLY